MSTFGSLANKTATILDVGYEYTIDSLPVIISSKSYVETAVEATKIGQPIHSALAGVKIILTRCLPPGQKYIAERVSLAS